MDLTHIPYLEERQAAAALLAERDALVAKQIEALEPFRAQRRAVADEFAAEEAALRADLERIEAARAALDEEEETSSQARTALFMRRNERLDALCGDAFEEAEANAAEPFDLELEALDEAFCADGSPWLLDGDGGVVRCALTGLPVRDDDPVLVDEEDGCTVLRAAVMRG